MTTAPATITDAQIRALLEQVKDPEIPVLNVLDMGVVRDVKLSGKAVEVTITPTYSGCPAMNTIEFEIRTALERAGFGPVDIKTVLSPAWTTDWLTETGKAKLFEYGIAPPEKATSSKRALFSEVEGIRCPNCKSLHTERVSEFGSTACKALYRCLDCREPFDYFKCI